MNYYLLYFLNFLLFSFISNGAYNVRFKSVMEKVLEMIYSSEGPLKK